MLVHSMYIIKNIRLQNKKIIHINKGRLCSSIPLRDI